MILRKTCSAMASISMPPASRNGSPPESPPPRSSPNPQGTLTMNPQIALPRPGAVPRRWDLGYEWKAVTLLCLGFGLVGIDRFMIMPLFPVMAQELKLDYQDLGHITGVLAIAWGVAAMFMGNLSDRLGHRKVVIPAIIVFSL